MDVCEVSQTVSKQSLRSNCFFPTLYFMQSGDRTFSLTCHVLVLPACYTWRCKQTNTPALHLIGLLQRGPFTQHRAWRWKLHNLRGLPVDVHEGRTGWGVIYREVWDGKVYANWKPGLWCGCSGCVGFRLWTSGNHEPMHNTHSLTHTHRHIYSLMGNWPNCLSLMKPWINTAEPPKMCYCLYRPQHERGR